MYTVVVADDEEQIRRSLIRKIDWNNIGFQLVGEAENGIEALELVERMEPDLLLTDIRMPFISGIELARQVREIRPTMQIAFLSGFDDFSYARQAIQYNIISYLLKPISSRELTRELRDIKEKIDQKFCEFASENRAQEKIEKSEFLTALLLDRFQNELGEEEYRELVQNAASCGILEREEEGALKYAVIVTSITDKWGKDCTTRSSVNAVDSILRKYVKFSSIYMRGKVISLLMATSMGFHKYLHILVDDIIQSVKRIMGFHASIGVSRVVNVLTGCHECYLQAMNALSYSEKTKSNVHFIGDEEQPEAFDQETIQNVVENIEAQLRGGTQEGMEQYLTDLFESIEEGRLSKTAADFVLLQIVSAVFQVLYAVAGSEAVKRLQERFSIHGMGVWGNAKYNLQFYTDMCSTAMELISYERKKNNVRLCDQAVEIINEQYTDPNLSLVSLSSEIGVSPNYLSVLMKKDKGSTFKDLLTKKRMETAKELLLFTNMKVSEVGSNCGYNDQHYFSYCFKKYEGISPNNFRRSFERNEENLNPIYQ